MVIASALRWDNMASVTVATVLAYAFGYLLTLVPLLRAGLGFSAALSLALARLSKPGISISLTGKFCLQGVQALSNTGRASKRTEKPHAVFVSMRGQLNGKRRSLTDGPFRYSVRNVRMS